MVEQKPFINLLKVINHLYIFDVNTNKIIETNGRIYNYLDSVLRDLSPLPLLTQEDKETLKNMLKEGLLQSRFDIIIEHVMNDQLENVLDYVLSRICLQVKM